MAPTLQKSGAMTASGDLKDDDLEDGLLVQIAEGDLKGKRGKIIGWVTAATKKTHGVHKSMPGMVTVLIGPNKSKNGKDGYMFFKQGQLRRAEKVDLEGTIAARDANIFNDNCEGCADEKIPPLKSGKNVMSVLSAGQANVIVESMLALKDDQSTWDSVKARGTGEKETLPVNKHVSYSCHKSDSSFIRSDVSLSKPFSEVTGYVEEGMSSVEHWDPNVLICRVHKELPLSETEKKAGVTNVRLSYAKLNTKGLDILSGERQINLLEVIMKPPGRELVAAVYVPCDFPECPQEGTSKVPGTGLIWAQSEGGGSVAGYIGLANQCVGWKGLIPTAEEIIARCPLPTACLRSKVEGEGEVGAPACFFGLFGC